MITVANQNAISVTSTDQSSSSPTSTTTQLTGSQEKGILYMVEEEKLARDVYAYLYNLWGITTFSNIKDAEQTHMDQVLSLVDQYKLQAPATLDSVGVFSDPHLQELYNTLINQGSQSVTDALKVGALIEETDIIDLQNYSNETESSSVKTVYLNLMNGSENHLRAFVSQLNSRNVSYKPAVLSQEAYNAIINNTSSQNSSNGAH
ncbi:MAG: DUF2202 domain-containing protein [Caldisericaceae bacterium]